jgi:hypothetical protein
MQVLADEISLSCRAVDSAAARIDSDAKLHM